MKVSFRQEYDGATAGDYIKGYFKDFRITKVARYSGNFTPVLGLIQQIPGGFIAVDAYTDRQYSISITLSESLAAIDFVAVVTSVATGLVLSRSVVSGTNITISLSSSEHVMVTMYPDYGKVWTSSTVYNINDKVFPSDPITTPYYYKRLVANTSGSVEPTWPTTVNGQCDDGVEVNAWELVERLVQPITHGPLVPV